MRMSVGEVALVQPVINEPNNPPQEPAECTALALAPSAVTGLFQTNPAMRTTRPANISEREGISNMIASISVRAGGTQFGELPRFVYFSPTSVWTMKDTMPPAISRAPQILNVLDHRFIQQLTPQPCLPCPRRARRSSVLRLEADAAAPWPHPMVRASRHRAPQRWSGSPAWPWDEWAR